MREGMHMTVVLALSLASLTLLDGCGCTAIGCLNEVKIGVDRTASTSQLTDGLFRVCRNTVCSEYVIRIQGSELVLADVRRDDLQAFLTGVKLGARIDLILQPNNEYDLDDGDEYSLQLLDKMGAVVEEWSWTADYTETYPNGRGCQDVPCRKVELI